jgi:SpoVK/Ycf46/Vps4 family AAA+-type ATPase
MLEFLELSKLWLLVPDQLLLHDLMLDSVSKIQHISLQISKKLAYDYSLSWVTDDLVAGLSSGKSYILWGESGVGKTTLAFELAKSMHGQIVSGRCFDLVHGGVGESEKELERLFKKAKDSQPSVLVLDDLDTLFKKRGKSGDLALKMVTQLILELDEIQFNNLSVLFLGTAINIFDLDESLWKSGRCNAYQIKKSK